jgi:predicted FMN-binding regulatory protein PaiB
MYIPRHFAMPDAKLSQNRSAADVDGVIAGLDDRAMADAMSRQR